MRDQRIITQSEITTWQGCRRRWWLDYHRKLRLKPSLERPSAAYIGTAVHAGLEAFYLGESVQEVFEDLKDEATSEEFDKPLDLAYIMVDGYTGWVDEAGVDDHWEILGVEETIETPFETYNHKVTLRGKVDLRVRGTQTGAEYIVDHKTASNLDDIPRLSSVAVQPQFYELIHGDLTDQPGGFVYNILKKVKRTARAKPPFFARHEIKSGPAKAATFRARVGVLVTEVLEAELLLDEDYSHQHVAPPAPTHSCAWMCPFFAVCSSFDDGSRVEEMIADRYIVSDPLLRYSEGKE